MPEELNQLQKTRAPRREAGVVVATVEKPRREYYHVRPITETRALGVWESVDPNADIYDMDSPVRKRAFKGIEGAQTLVMPLWDSRHEHYRIGLEQRAGEEREDFFARVRSKYPNLHRKMLAYNPATKSWDWNETWMQADGMDNGALWCVESNGAMLEKGAELDEYRLAILKESGWLRAGDVTDDETLSVRTKEGIDLMRPNHQGFITQPKFYLWNETDAAEQAVKQRASRRKALDAVDALTQEEQKNIALLYGADVHTVTALKAQNLLEDKAEHHPGELLSVLKDRTILNRRVLYLKAVAYNILSMRQGQLSFGEVTIGASEQDFLKYVQKAESQPVLALIQQRLEEIETGA